MDLEELDKIKNKYENNKILESLGLIIFFLLAIVFLVLNSHYGHLSGETYGRIVGYGLLYFLPWFFLKNKKLKNIKNICSILPLIAILSAFPRLLIEGEEGKASIIQIESFEKGLQSIGREFSYLRDSKDKSQREKFLEITNNYIDSYLRKSNSKSQEIINKLKIYKNELANSQEIWITSMTKIEELIAKNEGPLNFSDQDLKDINFFINSTDKMIELFGNSKSKKPRINDIRRKYVLFKNIGLNLKKVAEIYFSYLNNDINEARYNESIEKALIKFSKSQENLNNLILQK